MRSGMCRGKREEKLCWKLKGVEFEIDIEEKAGAYEYTLWLQPFGPFQSHSHSKSAINF